MILKTLLNIWITSLFILFPSVVLAQPTFSALVGDVIGVIGKASIFLMALAVVVFLWGMVRFIYSAGDSKANQEGKYIMVYGVIGLAVLFSIWGLTSFLQEAFSVR